MLDLSKKLGRNQTMGAGMALLVLVALAVLCYLEKISGGEFVTGLGVGVSPPIMSLIGADMMIKRAKARNGS